VNVASVVITLFLLEKGWLMVEKDPGLEINFARLEVRVRPAPAPVVGASGQTEVSPRELDLVGSSR